MQEKVKDLIAGVKDNSVTFKDVIAFIDANHQHQPTAFKNGETQNESTQNQGSARVFAFAQMNQLDQDDTLHLFAEHYQAVLNTPEGTDHQNIRQFIKNGWSGIAFDGEALTAL